MAEADDLLDSVRNILLVGGNDYARKAVGRVLAAYRTPDLFDPEQFVEMAVEALGHYPAVVVGRMASPSAGIITTSKFVPVIAELVAWCKWDLAQISSAVDSLKKRKEQVVEEQRKARIRRLREEWRANWHNLLPAFDARLEALPVKSGEVVDAYNVINDRCDAEAMDVLLRIAESDGFKSAGAYTLFGVMKVVYDIINGKSSLEAVA